jgi:hypothetical protein
MKSLTYVLLLTTPHLLLAQTTSLQNLLSNSIIFMDETVIPFLFGLAFLFFIVNVVRYFIIEGSSEDGREKAKNLAIYSAAAFTFLIIFWGVVNLVASSIGLEDKKQPCPDYLQQFDPTKCPT